MLNIEGEMVDDPTKETTKESDRQIRDNQERRRSREERGL